jgi:hypothetical protein
MDISMFTKAGRTTQLKTQLKEMLTSSGVMQRIHQVQRAQAGPDFSSLRLVLLFFALCSASGGNLDPTEAASVFVYMLLPTFELNAEPTFDTNAGRLGAARAAVGKLLTTADACIGALGAAGAHAMLVSSSGRVRRMKGGKLFTYTPKPTVGMLYARLEFAGGQRHYVHRVVAWTFLRSMYIAGFVVDHINRDKTCNCVRIRSARPLAASPASSCHRRGLLTIVTTARVALTGLESGLVHPLGKPVQPRFHAHVGACRARVQGGR